MAVKSSASQECASTLWLGLATAPFLLSLVVTRSLTQNLIELGQASEEIFRGDRLPLLNFPEAGEKS